MRLPKFNDVRKEKDQLAVYSHSPYESMLVSGPPGSGKTSMAIWRAVTLVSKGIDLRVVMITRNRLLTAIAGQLAKEEDSQIEISTMHSFVAKDHYARFGVNVPTFAGGYSWDWDTLIEKYSSAGIVPSLDHLIIDEGQNLPFKFFEWAMKFGSKKISIFADEHQTTLDDGVSIGQLKQLGFTHVFALLHNHRNTASIANMVGHFHVNRIIPQAVPNRREGDTPTMLSVDEWGKLADAVANRYRNRREAVGVITYATDDVRLMSDLLKVRLKGYRVDHYTNNMDAGDEFGIQMRDDGVTVISSESAIGLEFDTVYLQDLSRSLPLDSALKYRRMYMLCARARDSLILVNGPQPLTNNQINSLPAPPTLQR